MSVPIAASTAQWITAVAAIVGVVIALVGVLVAIFTILNARRISRRTAALSYVAGLGTAEFRALEAEAGAFFSCKEPPPGIKLKNWQKLDRKTRECRQWARWEELLNSWTMEDRQKVLTILSLPNQLEDIAGAYNLGLIDRSIVKTHIEYLVDDFWDKAGWWLNETRRNPNDNIYQDLAMMRPDLAKRKRPKWHRPKEGHIKRFG
jgi:hypothetical protein